MPRPKRRGHFTVIRRYQSKKTGRFVSARYAKRYPRLVWLRRLRRSTVTGRFVREKDLRVSKRRQQRAESKRLFKGTPKQQRARFELSELFRRTTRDESREMIRQSPNVKGYLEWLADHGKQLGWGDEEIEELAAGLEKSDDEDEE